MAEKDISNVQRLAGHLFAPTQRISRRDLFLNGALTTTVAAAPAIAHATPRPAATRKMHLGIVTYNVAKDWTLHQILANCKSAGIEGIEFRTTHKHGVETSLTADQRKEVKDKCAASGLLQISLGSICEFQAAESEVVKKNIATCNEFVLLAKDIGARGVKVRPNGVPKDASLDKTLEQIGLALRECGNFGAKNGIEIWMEVHGGTTQLCPNSRKIMDHCAHPNVGVTWNSNATDLVDGSVKQSFDLLRPFIRCCHITELWGNYPYREFFGLLNESGYDRFTLCEVGSSIQAEDGATFLKCYRGLWNELSK
jgi:sugar phosphate isomerase/epimerase